MTKQTKPAPEKSFVPSKLPWIVAGLSLLFYLVTLNRWISLNNLTLVAKSSGWLWGPEITNPLFFLVTYPFRWLPATAIPLAYNVLSAICGALVLALLARSVALLPHDRTQDQRLREKRRDGLLSIPLAWIAPVIAVAVCGLQLTFWENATTGAADLFDTLLLAYIVRCLLEFRIDENDSWLYRAALICGAAMANNWLMFVLFPAFLMAVVWIKRLEFFNARFLSRMVLFGSIGMLFYLLLPTLHVLSKEPMFTFWQALKSNLVQDKQAFVFFIVRAPVSVRLLIAITTLLPLLIIGIRWPSNFGDTSKMGASLATFVFHLVHAALFVTLLWIALDPVFSLRRKSMLISALPYLSALGIGYLAGYFLLVFKPLPDRMGRTTPVQILLDRVSRVAIIALLFVMPASLVFLNLPQIRITNGSAIRDYASALTENLPEGGIILSDDMRKLELAQAALAKAGKSQNYFFLDTRMLKLPGYHVFQKRIHSNAWPSSFDPKRKDPIEDGALLGLLMGLSQSNSIVYLHPSFGYYFEYFNQRPRGLNLELTPYATNSIFGLPLTDSEIALNENFWKANDSAARRLIPFITPPAATTNVPLKQVVLDKLQISFNPNATASALGTFYSQALDSWGVQLQRVGKLDEAHRCFEMAANLFPDNLAAENNLAFNRELRTGQKPQLNPPKSAQEELGRFRHLQEALAECGPFDDPTHCFGIGLTFAQGNLYRQAAQQLQRVHDLVPSNVQVSFWLARLYIVNQVTDKARALLDNLRDKENTLAESGIRHLDFLQTDITSLFVSGKANEANQLLRETVERSSNDQETLALVAQLSATFRSYTNALLAVDQMLKLKPDDVPALISKAVFNIQAGHFTNAIPPLNRVLTLQTNNYSAQLYRAVALLSADKLDEAHKDYESLQKIFPNSIEINSGFAEIAWRRKDTNNAVRYYELCLKNAPTGSEQEKFFSDRLNALKQPAK